MSVMAPRRSRPIPAAIALIAACAIAVSVPLAAHADGRTAPLLGCRGTALSGSFTQFPGSHAMGHVAYSLRLTNSSSESCTPQTARTQPAKPVGYSQAQLPKLLFVLTLSDGTSIFIRLKTPILRAVIFRFSRNSHYAMTGMFPMSRQPVNYPYAASTCGEPAEPCKSTLLTNSSLYNSPLISIARIILNNFLHAATIAIFLRDVCPAITRS